MQPRAPATQQHNFQLFGSMRIPNCTPWCSYTGHSWLLSSAPCSKELLINCNRKFDCFWNVKSAAGLSVSLMWSIMLTSLNNQTRWIKKNNTGHKYRPTSIMNAIIPSSIPPCLPLTPKHTLSLDITSRAESPVSLLWECVWERKQPWQLTVCLCADACMAVLRAAQCPSGKGVVNSMHTHL